MPNSESTFIYLDDDVDNDDVADDNGGNVRDVLSALPATHAILVPPKPGGMLAEQMQAAVSWARAQRDAARSTPPADEAGAVADAIASTHIDSLV